MYHEAKLEPNAEERRRNASMVSQQRSNGCRLVPWMQVGSLAVIERRMFQICENIVGN